jgi:hypothetical protein
MQCAATRTSLLRTALGVYAVTYRAYRAYRALFCARSGKGQEILKFDHLDKTKDFATPGHRPKTTIHPNGRLK